MNGLEQKSEDNKRFLYARATQSNHAIQYHMQQIIERQTVADEYRCMMMEGMGLIPLESNLHRDGSVVISQVIQMVEVDNFWHLKTFEAVLTNLQRRWDKVIDEQRDVSTHCRENSELNIKFDGKEVIDLCSKTKTTTSELHNGGESTKQERQDKIKSKTISRMESKHRSEKDKQTAESEENKTAMMSWENVVDCPGKEPHEESDDEGKKPIQKMKKP